MSQIKKALKKQLEEMYFQALMADRIHVGNDETVRFLYTSKEIASFVDLESQIYKRLQDEKSTLKNLPFKKAYKRYLDIQNSPLKKALEEKRDT